MEQTTKPTHKKIAHLTTKLAEQDNSNPNSLDITKELLVTKYRNLTTNIIKEVIAAKKILKSKAQELPRAVILNTIKLALKITQENSNNEDKSSFGDFDYYGKYDLNLLQQLMYDEEVKPELELICQPRLPSLFSENSTNFFTTRYTVHAEALMNWLTNPINHAIQRTPDYLYNGMRPIYSLASFNLNDEPPTKNMLFYISTGHNSHNGGTLLPTNGLKKPNPLLKQAPETNIWRLIKPKLNTILASNRLPPNDMLNLFESEFDKDICKNYFNTPNPDFHLLARFGNKLAMLISCAFGGGFWSDRQNDTFTDWFKKTYATEIKSYQQQINKQPEALITQELTKTAKDDILSAHNILNFDNHYHFSSARIEKIAGTKK